MKKFRFMRQTESAQESIGQFVGSILLQDGSNYDGFATDSPPLGTMFIYFYETSEIAYENI